MTATEQSQAIMDTVDTSLKVIHEEKYLRILDTTRWCNKTYHYQDDVRYALFMERVTGKYSQMNTLCGNLQHDVPLTMTQALSIASWFERRRKLHPESYRTCKCHPRAISD
jgi:hypothetical protein